MSSKVPAPVIDAAVVLPSASETWMEKNLKPLLIFVCLVIVALVAVGVVKYRTDAVAREAGGAFTAADSVDGFDAVIAKYPGSQAAANALLAKAEMLWEQNQKDSSTAALKTFLETNSKHPLVTQAKLALASRLDGMGEKAEAKKLYEELMTSYADSEVTPLAAIRLGDLLWSEGKTDEAKAIYETLPSKYPGTNQPFFDQSQERLKWVGAALPTKEVDPPAPPPAPPAPAGAAPTPAVGGAPAGAAVPPIQLGGAGATSAPMKVTVGANGVTTPAVEVKPAPAPAVEVTPKPANPEAVKPLAPKPIEAPKVEVPAPDAKPVEPKLEVPAPEAAAPAKP
jgi:predicted negative regulator of RcsB-dependent stress response